MAGSEWQPTTPIYPEAIEAIYVYSKGMPREACIIADNSLLAAFLSGKKIVDKDTVISAYKDRIENIGEDRSPIQHKVNKITKEK